MGYKVCVVEDHPLFREQLVQFLGRIDSLEVCAVAPSAEEALDLLSGVSVNLALLDISLPGMNGLDLAAEIKRRMPEVACVMLSNHRSQTYVETARRLGLEGYVVKGDLPALRKAIHEVIAGGHFFMSFD